MDGFAEFAHLFQGNLFVFVKVYGDESGTHDATGELPGSEVNCVGGYVASAEKWTEFIGHWQEILGKYRIAEFRFCARNYPHLSSTEQDSLLIELAEVVTRHTLFGVAACTTTKDFDGISQRTKKIIRHPYYLSVLSYYNMVMQGADKSLPSQEDAFAFFFDSNTEFAKHSIELFGWAKAYCDPHDRMSSPTHLFRKAPAAERIPLQAADLLAGRTRQKLTEALFEQKTGLTELDKALGVGTHTTLARIRLEGMKEMVATIEAHFFKGGT
jgi:hypothetical protein